MKKADDLLDEEFDILNIVKSIRKINKDQDNKFIIDLSEDDS